VPSYLTEVLTIVPGDVSPSDVARQTRRDEEGGNGNLRDQSSDSQNTESNNQQSSSLILSPDKGIPSYSDFDNDPLSNLLSNRTRTHEDLLSIFDLEDLDE